MPGWVTRQQVQSRYQGTLPPFSGNVLQGHTEQGGIFFCSPRKEQVGQALSIMRSFLHTVPWVCQWSLKYVPAGCLPGQNHSERKEKVPAGNFGCQQGYSFLPFQFPNWSRGCFLSEWFVLFLLVQILSLFQPV